MFGKRKSNFQFTIKLLFINFAVLNPLNSQFHSRKHTIKKNFLAKVLILKITIYLFWWLVGDNPSLWPSKIFLTKSKIIGGKVKMAAFNFFLKSNCNVGFKVRVKFQIWSKAMGSLNVTSLAAVTKTLKAVFATLEWLQREKIISFEVICAQLALITKKKFKEFWPFRLRNSEWSKLFELFISSYQCHVSSDIVCSRNFCCYQKK